jgi:uncharacterized protein (TIGR02217 family)
MTFYAVELDICPAYGWQAGPSGMTRIRTLRNGHERRNAEASIARHTFLLPFLSIRDADYLEYIKAAHMSMWAMKDSFLVKDWSDYQAVNEPLGPAPSGTAAVQLTRTYTFGPASRVRDIEKPVAGSIVYQNGVAKAGTLDTLTGLFTPSTSWAEGEPLTWTGEFRVPVRFNNDYMPMTIDNRIEGQNGNYAMNGSVELIEVFGE